MDAFVTLSEYQIGFADGIAYARRKSAIENDRKPRNGSPTDRKKAMGRDTLGTRSEAAGHVWTGLNWNALATRISGLPDLGDWIDIKGRSKAHYDLPVPKDGKPHWAYVLVDASAHPVYRIVGWLMGEEAMLDKFWDDPSGEGPAFFVPQNKLHTPQDLLAEIAKRKKIETS